MKEEEFFHLFPKASKSHFKEVDGSILFDSSRNFSEDDDLDDVEEPAFWQNENSVKYLNLSFTDFASYLLDKNNFLKTYKRMHQFSKKQIKDSWKHQEWNLNPNSIPPEIILKLQYIDFENFRIYVSNTDYFVLKDTLPDFSKILKIDFSDSKNVYCLSLKAMYILSYLGGVSLQNLKSENNLARSLAYFYFYYHLKKFFNYRNFSGYNTDPVEELPWSLYHWANHHIYYHSQIHYNSSNLKRKKDDVIANIHRDGKWIRYQVRSGKRDISKDYLKLINTSGNGITKIGQLLLQESNQAYVYCILGAQAKTRWKIIGDGTNSLQTQNVFKTLIGEVIAQNNLSSLIKSMRIAVTATKVELDFCISPGLELLPSDLVFIKDSPGYNNILLISSEKQKFGTNISVNRTLKRVKQLEDKSKDKSQVESKPPINRDRSNKYLQTGENIAGINNTSIILSSIVIVILGRLTWIALI